MGRNRIYATPEEAHEAKKRQMRENYQKRKAAKLNGEEPKKKSSPKKKETTPPLSVTIEAEKTWHNLSKEDLIKKVLTAVGEALSD